MPATKIALSDRATHTISCIERNSTTNILVLEQEHPCNPKKYEKNHIINYSISNATN